MTDTVVVVGHGMIGHRLVALLRERDHDGAWRIVLVSEERHLAYDRTGLCSSVGTERVVDLTLNEVDVLADPLVDLRRGRSVSRLDAAARLVVLDDGAPVAYDALVLATGASAVVPPVPGHAAAGCAVFRTLDDLDAIRSAADAGRPCVVVGGGLLGLEAAYALGELGMVPHVLERNAYPMHRQLDEAAGRMLDRLLADRGIRVHTGASLTAVEVDGQGRVVGVALDDGRHLESDLIIFAAGIRPRDELGGAPGPALAERGGYLVDELCRSVDTTGIWAVGDCAAVHGRCHGLVAPGYRMAEVVTAQLLGGPSVMFEEPDDAAKLKLAGVPVAGMGDVHAQAPGAVELVYERPGRYAKLVLDQEITLLGAVLAGDTSCYVGLRTQLRRKLSSAPEHLLGAA